MEQRKIISQEEWELVPPLLRKRSMWQEILLLRFL